MVKIILNSFLFWGGWIIIPFIMEIVPALGSVFLLIRRNLRHKLHKKELEVYPEITLIIPVYNSADTLYGCIRSINDSTYPNDRIRIFLVNYFFDCGVSYSTVNLPTYRLQRLLLRLQSFPSQGHSVC